jgi:dihydrofolate reductase
MTTGHILVMGRRTFQAIGRPLPNRHTLVLSRHYERETEVMPQPDLFRTGTYEVIRSPVEIDRERDGRRVFVCGGAEVYAELLPRCEELYLTRVRRDAEGDTFFPPFEHLFELAETLRETSDFTIERWQRRREVTEPD